MINSLQTLAHAGHDHAMFLGGELHHWLWIAAAATAVAFALRAGVRRWQDR